MDLHLLTFPVRWEDKDFFLCFKAKGSWIHWSSGAEGLRRGSDLVKLLMKEKTRGKQPCTAALHSCRRTSVIGKVINTSSAYHSGLRYGLGGQEQVILWCISPDPEDEPQTRAQWLNKEGRVLPTPHLPAIAIAALQLRVVTETLGE